MPMPIELFITFDDGSKELYYIPTDLMFNYKQLEQGIVQTNLSPWKWANYEDYFFIKNNKQHVVFIEMIPSKRIVELDEKKNDIHFWNLLFALDSQSIADKGDCAAIGEASNKK